MGVLDRANPETPTAQSPIYSRAAGIFINSIFPSSIGAVGLGQVLNQNASTIMQRLRDTRAAIDAADGGQLAPSASSQSWSIIQDSEDRARLSRYLEQLEYLTGLVKTAWNDQEKELYVDAAQKKLGDIDQIFVKWTGQPSEVSEPASRFAGDWTCGNIAALTIFVVPGGSLEGDIKGHNKMAWIQRFHGGSLTGQVRPLPNNSSQLEAKINFDFATGDKAVGEHFMLHKNDTRLSSTVGYFKLNGKPAGGIVMFCDRAASN
ncbi:MAG: hypothetical protein AB7P17_06885 [Nitrospirales bacterium]|nr:hypothetical protein [Nitrospirales bacterium]